MYALNVSDEMKLNIIRYMFKFDSLGEFGKRSKECGYNSTMEIRRQISNGYFLRNLKLWLYSGKSSKWGQFQVDEKDSNLFKVLDQATKDEIVKLRGRLRPISIEDMDYAVDHCIQEVQVYTSKYVYHKLRFIYKSEHFDPEDFVLELLGHCIVGIYNQFPRIDCSLHAVNVCKRIIKNMGTNIIKKFTGVGRATLYRNADGTFSSYKCSYDAVYDSIANMMDERQETTTFDHSLEKMLATYGATKATFLRCLTGTDKAFTEWLYENNYIRGGCSEDYHDRLIKSGDHDHYVEVLAYYLDVDSIITENWLKSFKVGLGYET